MVRISVVAIVLSLAMTPAAGIACELLCAPESRQEDSGSCHEDASGGTGSRIAAAHLCDHAASLAPFVVDAARAVAPAEASALPVPSTVKLGVPRRITAHWLVPPGDTIPSVPRLTSVLRI